MFRVVCSRVGAYARPAAAWRAFSTAADVPHEDLRRLVASDGWTPAAMAEMRAALGEFGVVSKFQSGGMPMLEGVHSMLFIPGNVPKMLEKSMHLADENRPDVLIPDLEDSVADSNKVQARKVLASYLPKLHKARLNDRGVKRSLLVPRVNSVNSEWFVDDLEAVISANIDGISIGKVRVSADLVEVSGIISDIEERKGLPMNSIKLVPWLESASAVVNASHICSMSHRVMGVAFGAEDYTADVGIERTETGEELNYAKVAIALAAHTHGLKAFDSPHPNFRDMQVVHADCRAAKQQAYSGKFAIHPAQVSVINKAFSPTLTELWTSLAVLDVAQRAEAEGRGTTSLNGMMVDAPVIARSRKCLQRWLDRADRGFQVMSDA